MNFLESAFLLKPDLVKIRQSLHRFPELSWQEIKTTEFIAQTLKDLDFEVIEWTETTGLIGVLHGGKPGKTVALRADIDALPILEENDLPYKSQHPGIMHACGHDAHIACLLGAAMLLARQKDELSGTVKLIFQPAEEVGGGANLFVEKNVLKNPDVAAIFGLHCYNGLPVGTIGLKEGPLMGANDLFRVVLTGKGGHGAIPHQARDPIVAAAAMIQAVQTLISRRLDPIETAVISFGIIQGGTAGNVIPEKVELTGTLRTMNPLVRDSLVVEISKVVQQIGEAYEVAGQVVFLASYPAVINPLPLTLFCQQSLTELLAAEKIVRPTPSMATEDFSVFQQEVPGVFIWLGTGNGEKEMQHPWHHSCFNIDEEALPYGAAMLAKLAHDFLQNPKENWT